MVDELKLLAMEISELLLNAFCIIYNTITQKQQYLSVIANIDEGKYPIITRYGCGRVVKAGSSKEYAKGVEYFVNLNEAEMNEYKEKAIETAKKFDTDEMNHQWEMIIAKCIEANKKNNDI